MRIFRSIYDAFSVFLLTIVIWICCVGGGYKEKKWAKMKKWMEHHHHHYDEDKGKTYSISLKPIPIPIAMKGDKGDKEMPWASSSNDMFWQMMMMKMMKGNGDKKADSGCCPQMMPAMMPAAMPWTMMPMQKGNGNGNMKCCSQPAMPMMKAWPMMQMNGWPMMQNGGMMKSKGCAMPAMNGGWSAMNAGWPMMNSMMCCPSSKAEKWPAEEEEEEDEYDEGEVDDTNNVFVYSHPFNDLQRRTDKSTSRLTSKKGDASDDFNFAGTKTRTIMIFRKGAKPFRPSFENDFD